MDDRIAYPEHSAPRVEVLVTVEEREQWLPADLRLSIRFSSGQWAHNVVWRDPDDGHRQFATFPDAKVRSDGPLQHQSL